MNRPLSRALATLLVSAALYGTLIESAGAIVFEPRDFASVANENRYKVMIQELRCLVCQNQNIADSNAPLAQDLRREVFRMIDEGRSDDEIIDYMVARYGDFVLYRPPVKGVTLALWIGPAALGLFGLVFLLLVLRRRKRAPANAPLSAEEQARLAALVGRGGGESG